MMGLAKEVTCYSRPKAGEHGGSVEVRRSTLEDSRFPRAHPGRDEGLHISAKNQ